MGNRIILILLFTYLLDINADSSTLTTDILPTEPITESKENQLQIADDASVENVSINSTTFKSNNNTQSNWINEQDLVGKEDEINSAEETLTNKITSDGTIEINTEKTLPPTQDAAYLITNKVTEELNPNAPILIPPYKFPKGSEKLVKFVNNPSLRKSLEDHDRNNTNFKEYVSMEEDSDRLLVPEIFPEYNGMKLTHAEWIKNQKQKEGEIKKDNAVVQGQSALILAIVFVAISLFGYVGLLAYRKFLERKYGSREMLVNEDDYYDPADLKYFSIA